MVKKNQRYCSSSQALDEEFYINTISLADLTIKAPIMTEADDIHKYFFIVFQGK